MARIGLTLCWLASVALGAAPVGPGKAFELQVKERVVLLGDTLIEREQLYGFVEQWFTTQSPERHAIFRNLGWSADTPAALSRASFDFETPEKGFQRLKDQLVALQPTLVVLGYGMANSFSGEAGLAQFKTEMNRLVDTVRSCTTNGSVRFIVLSPLPHEDLGRPLPDPAAHNRQLELYTRALRELAVTQKCEFVSLYDLLKGRPSGRPQAPLTDDGIHLTAYGYSVAAEALGQGLGAGSTR